MSNEKLEMGQAKIKIRSAESTDAPLILTFIQALADYEKAPHEVVATVEDIRETLFQEATSTHALICESDGQAIGFAVYFTSYSTWLGKHGIYLEDLFVLKDHRGKGAGKALLKHIAQIAVANDCPRFEWSVLDWNEPAIKFYEAMGAEPQSEWIKYRLSGDALRTFADSG